ncbi:ATP-binding cassette domain-containing protein [Candidatus Nitrosacidococcus sp. I8]|uniref:ATP-binding cassette domain-containing protein n=1 Tax=Candidatus Nitrosacidococcus sp. I8 TaxID=2942908 RepID=UPI002227FFD4|nr:ATP-binding cassette domain-containing protein [Candidatus Nitrosacidococcus sp. I8]CAH9017655.1 Choline transport ATP-binding protein OpuBA [Candidatus Nitrosacidococcus sp. I8]
MTSRKKRIKEDKAIVILENVSKSYSTTAGIQHTSLNISQGQITALIGPSGCGKSTLLRLIVGLITPDSGCIYFEGTQLTPENILAQRQKMGYVIQEGGLFPHYTAQENIALVANYLNWDQNKIDQRLRELVALARFPEDALKRYPVQLSGGQRQRVALMRALMLNPDLLLLDEPLGALDPLNRYEMQAELREIFQSLHKTVILVTHDIGEAAYFSDHILLLRDGKIIQEGTVIDFLENPADPFVKQFIEAQRCPLDSHSSHNCSSSYFGIQQCPLKDYHP